MYSHPPSETPIRLSSMAVRKWLFASVAAMAMTNLLRRFLNRPDEHLLKLKIQFVVEPDGDGGFHAFSPSLPGLHADGQTQDEAAGNFVTEVPAYLQSLAKHGDPLPVCTVEIVKKERTIPAGAFLRHVQVQWPSLQTSGASSRT